jgi:4-amino-4-deoxy-L-arabinose transferase-like glycosyltransferase
MLLFAYFAALVPALLMAATQPVWSRVDEAQHADFIVQLSHGVYPVADHTLISADTLEVMMATGVFRGAERGTYPTPDLADVGLPPPGMSAQANAVWMSRHLWQLSFESVQTPGYYALMVPVWWVADHLGGPFAAIYTIRVIDALLIALLAPMAVAVARVLTPPRSELAVLAAMFAILLPGLVLNGTRISNDGLAAVLGGLAVLLVVRWAGTPWTWRRTALLGLVLGAGLTVKLTLAGLVPALAVAAMWPVPGSTWRQRAARAAVAVVIAVACLIPWFLLNLHNYGALMPGAGVARLSDAVPSTFTALFVPYDLALFALTYWSGEPFGALPLSLPFSVLGSLLALMALLGVIRLLRTRHLLATGPLVVAMLTVGGLVALALLLPAMGGFEFAGAGRYIYPALPAAAALCAIGISEVLTNAVARRAVSAFFALAAVGILAAGAAGLPGAPAPGPGQPPPGAKTISVAATGRLEGVAISVDRVVFDTSAKVTWFEVRATNSGPGEAEWSVVPVASAGGVLAYGDYRRSTHLPGDLEAGQSATGWLLLLLDPASLHPGQPVRLRFANVAVNGYSRVEDVDVVVNIETSPSGG